MSSRNQYLTGAERAVAPTIHRQLQRARTQLLAGTAHPDVEAEGLAALTAAGFRPDYFVVRDPRDLQQALPGSPQLVVLAAARLGKARLIDNLRVMR
jgi:pantoate--beta-alanine ligase